MSTARRASVTAALEITGILNSTRRKNSGGRNGVVPTSTTIISTAATVATVTTNSLQPSSSEVEEEEYEEDEDEVTRCVCMQTESFGTMVQCERCKVWQHCDCMNLNAKRLPKHYFCEECKPQNHPWITAGKSNLKSSANTASWNSNASQGRVSHPKKRQTMNSREAAQSYSELLSLKPDVKLNTSATQRPRRPSRTGQNDDDNDPDSPSSSEATGSKRKRPAAAPKKSQKRSSKADANGREGDDGGSSDEETEQRRATSDGADRNAKRRVNGELKSTGKRKRDDDFEADTTFSADVKLEDSTVEATDAYGADGDHQDTDGPEKGSRRATPSYNESMTVSGKRSRAPVARYDGKPDQKAKVIPREVESPKKKPKIEPARRTNGQTTTRAKAGQRRSGASNISPSNDSKRDNKRQGQSNSGPSTPSKSQPPQRAGTPPIKVRTWQGRASFGEMNKRVKQLSDYITRLQVAMAAEPKVELPPLPSSSFATMVAPAPPSFNQADPAILGPIATAFPSITSSSSPVNLTPPQRLHPPPSTPEALLKATSQGSERHDAMSTSSLSSLPTTASTDGSSPGADRTANRPAGVLHDEGKNPQNVSAVAGEEGREETSLEMLDRLNLRLIKFQERYGSIGKKASS